MKPTILFRDVALADVTRAYDEVEAALHVVQDLSPAIGGNAAVTIREALDALMRARWELEDAS